MVRRYCAVRLELICSVDFELDNFRQKMDEQGLAVAENQENSLKSRRRLAETTRGEVCAWCSSCLYTAVHAGSPSDLFGLGAEFKKGASPELNRDMGTLLKAYQEEVDRLTTRHANSVSRTFPAAAASNHNLAPCSTAYCAHAPT